MPLVHLGRARLKNLSPLKCLVAGVIVAFSLPPFGFWILAPIGIAILYRQLDNTTYRQRFLLGFIFGIGYFGISYYWITALVVAGYIVLLIFESLLNGVASSLSRTAISSTSRIGTKVLRFAAIFTLIDEFRWSWPFGGMPMGSISLGQASSPIGQLGRVGGPLLVEFVVFLLGASIAEIFSRNFTSAIKPIGAIALISLIAIAFAPNGGGPISRLKVASVQGGGTRGLHAIYTNANLVYERQLIPTEKLKPSEHIGLILWPEDVIALSEPLNVSQANWQVAQIAKYLHTTLVAGVTQTIGASHFLNEAVSWGPTGGIVGSYEKVHRVPFGEYIPDRSFFAHFGPTSLVPRDAIAGKGPGIFTITSAGGAQVTGGARAAGGAQVTRKLGVAISFEVLFPSRARSGVENGAQLIIIPTNDASYKSGQVPAQEVAADQLRAIEEGRDLIQAAPTGYSDFVNNKGTILARSRLGSQQILIRTVTLRTGRTWYSYLGDWPMIITLLILALI